MQKKKLKLRKDRVTGLLVVLLAIIIVGGLGANVIEGNKKNTSQYDFETVKQEVKKAQYFNGATLKKLNSYGDIKIKDENGQVAEFTLENITFLYSENASAYIKSLLADNMFTVEYSGGGYGQIYIDDEPLTEMLNQNGYVAKSQQ